MSRYWKAITIYADDDDSGTRLRVTERFQGQFNVIRCDLLKDWIEELTVLYNAAVADLEQEFGLPSSAEPPPPPPGSQSVH